MSRILVVEDHPLNMELVRDVLELAGHEPVTATDVPEALEVLARGEVIDVAVLDVQVPGGGGQAVLRKIRETPALEHIPVVAVTALSMKGDRERLLAAGFDGYLSKPIDTRTFAADVMAFVHNRPRGGP